MRRSTPSRSRSRRPTSSVEGFDRQLRWLKQAAPEINAEIIRLVEGKYSTAPVSGSASSASRPPMRSGVGTQAERKQAEVEAVVAGRGRQDRRRDGHAGAGEGGDVTSMSRAARICPREPPHLARGVRFSVVTSRAYMAHFIQRKTLRAF